jgi:integrase
MAVWKLPKLPSGRQRNNPWRAKVRGRIHDSPTCKDAEHWERTQLHNYATAGLPLTIDALRKITVGEIIKRYLKEKTPLKGGAEAEEYFLEKFLRDEPMCKLSLAVVRKSDAVSYRDKRLKDTWKGKPISRSTVKRQIGILHNIFAVAKDDWGYENLANPFDKMNLKDNPGRERPLKRGELERIIEACKRSRGKNPYYMPLAIYLTIETGMRQQEVFNLLWSDIDYANRRIVIRNSKTDHLSELKGRTIVLTFNAMCYLMRLALLNFGPVDEVVPHKKGTAAAKAYWQTICAKDEPVFPMTKGAFKQAWRDAVKIRAGIKDLQYRDLRHEAGTWFDKAGLTGREHGVMVGHKKRTMRDRYIHAELQSIQNKLDRFVLGGVTLKEHVEKVRDEAAHDLASTIPSDDLV